MNRASLYFLVYINVFALVASILQITIEDAIGTKIFYYNSYMPMFLCVKALIVLSAIYLLIYFFRKKYFSAVISGSVYILTVFFHITIIFIISKTGNLKNYFFYSISLLLISNFIFALVLILSKAGKRPLLKIIGIAYLFFSLIYALNVVSTIFTNITLLRLFERFNFQIAIASHSIYVLWIVNYIQEIGTIRDKEETSRAKLFKVTLLSVFVLTIFAVSILFRERIAKENATSKYWDDYNYQRTVELNNKFEEKLFINKKGDSLVYHLLEPLNFDSTKKYPLVVSLPYGGGISGDKIKQIDGAVAANFLSNDYTREKYPCFIFIPNCPPGGGWGGIPGYPSVDSLVFETLSMLNKERTGIDLTRQYVVGLSRGGYGAWNFISKRPDLFAAAIPVAGGGDVKYAMKINDVAVWAFHGENDINVSVNESRKMINAMKKAGRNPKYTELQNEGHNIWDQVSKTEGLWEWLFMQRKKEN